MSNIRKAKVTIKNDWLRKQLNMPVGTEVVRELPYVWGISTDDNNRITFHYTISCSHCNLDHDEMFVLAEKCNFSIKNSRFQSMFLVGDSNLLVYLLQNYTKSVADKQATELLSLKEENKFLRDKLAIVTGYNVNM